VRLFVLMVGAGLLWGCSHSPYQCEASSQCLDNGIQGRCEPQGFCSFPDATCSSGDRFENNAGDGLGGTCVPDDNETVCGSIGQACCAEGNACNGNGFCDGGTCSQCIVEVSHGITHSCFLKHDGTIWCSGDNGDGQLGNGSESLIPVATAVQVREDAQAQPVITDAIALGMGENFSCAIRADHTVWCWGENGNCDAGGQLGNGATSDTTVAVQVLRDSDNQPLTDIAEVHGAGCFTCARDSNGGVWCWGSNDGSWLGDGSAAISKDRAVQVVDSTGPLTDVVEMGVGVIHGCARKSDNTVWCWGINDDGQLGNNSRANSSIAVQTQISATALAVGRFHNCGLQDDGTVECWGDNRHGRLGNGEGNRDIGDTADRLTPTPVLTEFGGQSFANVAQVAAGAMSCLVTTAGDPYCWGVNLYGQTGTGTGSYVPAPVLGRDGLPVQHVARLAVGFHRACAFKTSGDLVCWGRNSEGQLGDGEFINRGLAEPVGVTCP